jgi:hypothetical protein
MSPESFPTNNIEPSTEKLKSKGERKYFEYLSSPLGVEISKRDLMRNSGLFEKKSQPEFDQDDFTHGAMAMHDYVIELIPTGNVEKDAEFLFRAVNAEKLIERLEANENPVDLLKELKTGMQIIIDNSDKPEFRDNLWKAIETKIVIEDILNSI